MSDSSQKPIEQHLNSSKKTPAISPEQPHSHPEGQYQSIFKDSDAPDIDIEEEFGDLFDSIYSKGKRQFDLSFLKSSIHAQGTSAQCSTQKPGNFNTQSGSLVQGPIVRNRSFADSQAPSDAQAILKKVHLTLDPDRPQPVPQLSIKNQNKCNVFNDDESLIEQVKKEKKDVKIEISIKAQRSMVKLEEAQTVPAMISLKTQGGSRTNVDLICVIDVSGSMSGQKIELVKSTMKYLLEVLTPFDRLSIITFNTQGRRICGLKCATQENLVSFGKNIDNLDAYGGTSIVEGINLAFQTMRERRQTNNVTSIFLLSDGQDQGADAKVSEALKQQEEILGNFSIHSFGFGSYHDENLMTKICKLKDGCFYFIKQLATLDQAFCNALGGIISLAAKDVEIKLTNIAQNLVKGISIKKTYGKMWNKINQNEYRIKILQLMSGISKDYVFELDIPMIDCQVGDLERDHNILASIFTATNFEDIKLSGDCTYKLTLLNENEEIPQINENVDVIENHLRVIASEGIEENIKKADEQKYEQAQKGIDDIITSIKQNKKARQEKIERILKDLEKIKQTCSRKKYHIDGRKYMTSATVDHTEQDATVYRNQIQTTMSDNLTYWKRNNHTSPW